jgi:hypothetical protein
MKTALITGINGMDGSHLADFLLTKGYKIYGVERRSSNKNSINIKHLGSQITLLQGDLTDQNSLLRCLKESNPEYFTSTVTYPITGTGLYQEAEPEFFQLLPWEKRTDRDINFRRTYPRRYYDYAIRFLISELDAHKAYEARNLKKYLRSKYRVLKARAGMLLYRIKGLSDPGTVKPSKDTPKAKPDRSRPASLKQVPQA